MTLKFKIMLLAGVLALGLCGGAVCGPLEDGKAAVLRGDYLSAMRLLGPVAKDGNPAAQYELGRMYEGGQGVTQDYARAASWYRKAAIQGDAKAQLLLALMYARGQGVPQDDAQGLQWLAKWGEHEDNDKKVKAKGFYYGDVPFIVENGGTGVAGVEHYAAFDGRSSVTGLA
ncbi:MAG: tetratricopeptide repeat protein [Caulobacteraceae bacterium]